MVENEKKEEVEEGPYEIMEKKFSQISSYIKGWNAEMLEELILFLIRRIKQMVKGQYKETDDEDPYASKNDIVIFIKGWEVEKLEELILFLIKRIEKGIKDGYKLIISKYVDKMKEMKKELIKAGSTTPPYFNNSIRYGVYKQD